MIDFLRSVIEGKAYKAFRLLITNIFYRPLLDSIGKMSIIYPPIIMSGLKYINIGEHALIFANSRIEVIDSYGNIEYKPRFKLGDYSQIHQNCHITCAGDMIIGKNVVITANVTITNIVHPYINIDMPINHQEIKVKDISIGDQTYIYNNVVIMPGVNIGKHCIIGTHAVVYEDVPNYSVVVGNPGRIVKQYNEETKQWVKIS
jgi:acetyltransferase-like isoleucine patch superfamily enzyme